MALSACAEPNELTIARPLLVPGAGYAPGVLYAVIDNRTALTDTLVAIELRGTIVTLHASMSAGGGPASMAPAGHVAIPAHQSVRLAPGGLHAMVEALPAGIARGDSVAVTFRFARGGARAVFAHVVDYRDVDSLTSTGR